MTTARNDLSFRLFTPLGLSHLAVLLAASMVLWSGCSGGAEDDAAEPAADGAAPEGEAALPEDGPAPGMSPEMAAAMTKPEPKEPAKPGAAPFDTTFLDVDTELFVFARLADILNSSLVQTLTGGNLGPLDDVKREIGIDPREIASVTIGVRHLAQLAQSSGMPMGGMGGGMPPGMGGPMPGMGGPMPGMGAGVPPGAGTPGQMPEVDVDGVSSSAAGPSPQPAFGAGEENPGFGRPMSPSPDAATMTMQPPAGASSPTSPTQAVVAVVRTSDRIDTEAFERDHIRRVPYGESAYYEVTQPNRERVLLYLHDAQTLVMADEAAIKQIIDEGEKRPRPTADLGFVKTAPHLLIAVVPKDKSALFGGRPMIPGMGMGTMPGGPAMQPMPGGPGFGARPNGAAGGGNQRRRRHGDNDDDDAPSAAAGPSAVPDDATLFQEHTDAVALLVDLTSGIGLRVDVKCDTPEAAQAMRGVVETGLEQLRAQYAAAKSTLPGMIQQMAQPVVDGLASETTDTLVTVSTALPEEQQGSLAMLPAVVMGMMMSGGAGLGGNFGMGGENVAMEASRELIVQEVVNDGQPAANTDELPVGVEVKALARWGESKYGDQAPAPLELNVVAVGGPAAQAIGYGKLTLTEAKSADGTDLKWEGAASDGLDDNPIAGFVPIERDGLFSEHPDDGVMAGILLTPPAEPATMLASATGQFTMQVPGSTEDVLVTNLGGLQGGRVETPKLADAAVTAKLDQQGQLHVAYNESPLIGKIEPVTADGSAIETAGTGWTASENRKTLTFSFLIPAPDDLALRVTTYADVQEVVVPFRFAGLPLPDPQPLSDQQQALLVWTRGDSPPDHPDLVIEAQGRWKTLQPIAGLERGMPPIEQGGLGFGAGAGFEGGTAGGQLPNAGGMPVPGDGREFGGFGAGEAAPGTPRRGRSRKRDEEDDEERFRRGLQPGQPSLGQMSLDGLPEGGFPGQGGQAGGGSDQPLQVVIDLIGPLAESTEAVGELHFSAAKSDVDTEIAFEGGELPVASGDPVEEFVSLDPGSRVGSHDPPNGLRLIVKLTPPAQPIGGLALLSGTVTLRTVRERAEAVIPNLQSRVGKPDPTTRTAAKPVSDRELLRFGLKPVVAIEPNRVMMRLLEGREERVADVALVDRDGVPLRDVQATTVAGTGPAKGHTVYMFDFAGSIPQKIGMKVSVNMGVKDIEVPIRIHNMPLPPMPTDAR